MVRTTSQDYSNLIGLPYSEKDCWGIVVAFYRQVFGIELQPYYSEVPTDRKVTERLVYSARKDFDSVSDRKFGDIVLMKMLGFESHIGVYLGEGKLLHTQEKTGCVIDSLAKWEKIVIAFYRPKLRSNDDQVS